MTKKIVINKPQNFAEYDAEIRVLWNININGQKPEIRQIGFIPFYRNYEIDWIDFARDVHKTVQSISEVYENWPDGEISIQCNFLWESVNF